MAHNNAWQLLGALAMTGLAICYLIIRYQKTVRRLRYRLEIRHAEHERIARELNDALLQGIQALILHFHAIAEKLPEDNSIRASIDQALVLAEDVLIDGRNRIHDLRVSEAELAKILK